MTECELSQKSIEHTDTDVIEALVRLCLTRTQSKVYVSALKLGRTTAKEIATECALDAATVHHRLEELVDLGILEKELGVPSLFIAREPAKCVEVLLERCKVELNDRIQTASRTIHELNQLVLQRPVAREQRAPSMYKLLASWQELEKELLSCLQGVENEVLLMIPPRAIGIAKMKIHREEKRSHDRGVTFRLITDVAPQYTRDIRMMSRFMEIRRHVFLGMTLLIFDRRTVIFGPEISFTGSFRTQPSLVCNEGSAVEAFAKLFESIWDASSDWLG